jgi:hypothetical protein
LPDLQKMVKTEDYFSYSGERLAQVQSSAGPRFSRDVWSNVVSYNLLVLACIELARG